MVNFSLIPKHLPSFSVTEKKKASQLSVVDLQIQVN